MPQIDTTGKRIDLHRLARELTAAGIPHGELALLGPLLVTVDSTGQTTDDWPPEAQTVVDAHTPPPPVTDVAAVITLPGTVRTTNDTPTTVLTFPCEPSHLYVATAIYQGVVPVSFDVSYRELRYVWKRAATGGPLIVGEMEIAFIPDQAASAHNARLVVSGNDVLFQVIGGRTQAVDWLCVVSIQSYAPSGLSGGPSPVPPAPPPPDPPPPTELLLDP